MRGISIISNHLATSREVCIVAAGRSPLCPYKGDLSGYTAIELAALTLNKTLSKHNISPGSIQEFYLGNVFPSGLGQSPAKQIAIKAGLSESVVCSNVNKVCSSGMLAIIAGFMSISQGTEDVVAAGGVDSLSNVPYFLPRNSTTKLDSELIDGLLKDGLWDPRYNIHMGECAERCAEKYSVSRQEMDEFSLSTNQKAFNAIKNGKFINEIIPVPYTKKEGLITEDVIKGPGQDFGKLRTVFRGVNGKITPGNASPLTDGAAMVVLSTRAKAQEMGWKVLGTIASFAHAEQNNLEFTTSPNLAVRKALHRAKLKLENVDFFELNEAFSVVGIVNTRLLGIKKEKVNVYGGAVALGHPLGCSGTRIVVTLLSVLKQENGNVGVAGVCNGGGGASALVIRV